MSDREFLRLDYALWETEGLEVAIVFDIFRWHADRGPWVATIEQIMDAARLGRKAVLRATRRLRELGLVASRNADYGTRTQAWSLHTKFPIDTHKVPNGNFAPYTDHQTNYTPDADAPVIDSASNDEGDAVIVVFPGDGEPMNALPEPTEQPMIDGLLVSVPSPDPGPPPKTGQTLVARWVDGYRDAGGGPVYGPVLKRVAGQCGRLAKQCSTDADWSAAWHACYAAGRCGHVDPVPHMVQQQSRWERKSAAVEALKATGPMSADALAVFASIGIAPDQPRAIEGR